MALASIGIKISRERIIGLLRAGEQGTWNRDFPKVAEFFKRTYIVSRNSTIGDLRVFHAEGFRLIVGYILPKDREGHYAVVRRITDTHIELLDPWLGPKTSYSISSFVRRWHNDFQGDYEKHWFFGIK